MKPSQAVRHRSVVWKSVERAQELASYIRIGSLSLELTELRSSVVAAQLGEEAISTSLIAGLIGLIIVISVYDHRLPCTWCSCRPFPDFLHSDHSAYLKMHLTLPLRFRVLQVSSLALVWQ